jgi:opacity protein-like surface antigen
MKKTLLVVSILLLNIALFAQQTDLEKSAIKAISVNFGLDFALPMGDFSDFASMGVGGDVTFEYPFSSIFIGTGSIGYLAFGSEDIDLGIFGKFTHSNSAVPINVGAKIFLSEKKDFYAIIQAGLHILTTSVSVINPQTKVTTENSETSVQGGFAIGGGYLYPVSENIFLDASMKYQYGTENTSYINVRGGIRFSL